MTIERFDEDPRAQGESRQGFNIDTIDRCAHRCMDDLRYPGAHGKLRKQAIASIGAVQPTITTGEWLSYMYITLTDFEAIDLTRILGAKVPIASILTDARAHLWMISDTLMHLASCASKQSRCHSPTINMLVNLLQRSKRGCPHSIRSRGH
jgi:hypothetical protein